MFAVARHAGEHRAPESCRRPVSDTGAFVRRDIGRKQGANRSCQWAASGERATVVGGMTGAAISDAGESRSLLYRFRREACLFGAHDGGDRMSVGQGKHEEHTDANADQTVDEYALKIEVSHPFDQRSSDSLGEYVSTSVHGDLTTPGNNENGLSRCRVGFGLLGEPPQRGDAPAFVRCLLRVLIMISLILQRGISCPGVYGTGPTLI